MSQYDQQLVEQKLADSPPEIKALIDRLRSQASSDKKPDNAEQQSSPSESYGSFAVASEYALRDSVILDSATTVHVINDRTRFISDIRPASDQLYAGSGTKNIEGFGAAEVTVITPLGRQKIHLNEAAYVPGFHTNLVCMRRLIEKGVFWNSEKNYLYRRGGEKFAYCGYHHGQVTLEYNELKPSTTEPLPN